MRLAVILWVLNLLILVKIAREEGENSVIVNIPNSLNKEVIVVVKNKDRDIIIDLNNNIMLIRSIKVVILLKFLG